MRYFSDFLELLFPRYCPVCGARLAASQQVMCAFCFSQLPFTHIRGKRENYVERLFWDLPIQRASSYLHYRQDSSTQRLLHMLKYYDRPQVGQFFGRAMANDLLGSDFFDGVDVLLPVPLSKERQHRRGYNQSMALAEGVAQITKLPIDTHSSVRVVDNPTQTSLTRDERKVNVAGIFSVTNAENLRGRHLLLIDDVLTTGATLRELISTLASIEGLRVSVLTLALAGGTLLPINTQEP